MEMERRVAMQGAHGIGRYLPQIIVALFVIQPVLDVISYWLIETGRPTILTLYIRSLMLVFTVLLGFLCSKRKWAYVALGAVLVLIAAGHMCACVRMGYQDPAKDIAKYIRVIQLPLFTFSFITFLRRTGKAGYKAIEKGFAINFVIILTVEILSVLTGTNPYTYANKGIGVMGWFYWPNTQSAVLSAVIPIVLMLALRKKSILPSLIVTAIGFFMLFLYATRLTYAAIFGCAIGFVCVFLLCRKIDKRKIAVLLIGAALCAAAYPVSPMYQNQVAQRQVAEQAQREVDEQIAQAEKQYHTTRAADPEVCLLPVYQTYLGGMLERFGTERVMEAYAYTSDVTQLKDWRRMELLFCRFLMQDAGVAARIFGMEIGDIVQGERTYDVENDFHSMYYLYGIVGFFGILLFLLYFILLVLRALLLHFSQYMTLEIGGFLLSLGMMLLHIAFTASILRRNNASFYLSVVLAVLYYLVNTHHPISDSRNIPCTTSEGKAVET